MRNVAFAVLRLVLLSAIFAGWFVSTPDKSYACSCIMSGSPASELARAAAVFTATVTDINAPDGPTIGSGDHVKITFAVDRVWKGPKQGTLVATTARSGASCGYRFEEGMDYIVYAHGDESDLKVGLCSRTSPLSYASADLEKLGQASTPSTVGADSGKDPQSIGCNAPLHSGPRDIDLSMANSAGPRFKKDAPNIHVPVLFHMQWDDELFSRESQCELFDLIGSEDKRLISYPGPQGRAHPESIDQWCRFVEGHIKS